MSLLTEEQINDILDIANVCSSSTSAKKLIEWNEKQTTQQIEIDWNEKQQPSAQYAPDWDTAPEKAVQAVVNSFWVDKNGDTFGVYKTYYDRPAPVITPHPHAGIIMKYAEVAQRRTNPWVEFEIKDPVTRAWTALNIPITFFEECEYRYTGDDK